MFEPIKSNIPNSKLKATMWQRILQNPFKASHTPGKINIEPENDGLEDDIFFQGARIHRFHVNLLGVVCLAEKKNIRLFSNSKG